MDNRFDGDVLHLVMAMTEEATKEMEDFLNTREYYISDNGKLYFSASNEVIDSVLKFLT